MIIFCKNFSFSLWQRDSSAAAAPLFFVGTFDSDSVRIVYIFSLNQQIALEEQKKMV